jgi:hypothetical protein
MKRIGLIVGVLGLMVVTSAMAATNVFTVTKLRGVITKADGSKIKVAGSDLTTNNVEMFVSDNLGTIIVRKISGTTTNTLIDTFRSAFTAGGKFNSDLEGSFTPSNTNTPPFLGDLQITGKLSPATAPTKVSATLVGVWRNTPNDATFKGTISGAK